MKKLLFYASILMLILMNSAAFACLIGTGDAGWQPWTEAVLYDENNIPYWDGASWDGADKNVGNYLTNTGGFSGSSAGPGAIAYWGYDDGSADPNFYFESNSSTYNAVIKFEIAGFKDDNIFGWYEVDTGTPHMLFDGSAGPVGPGSEVSFSPGVDYGYYLTSPQGHTFYTQSSRNMNDDEGIQHFAVFKDPADYSLWIGVEDLLSACRTDEDYNDFGAKINRVPESATMLLLGSGLIVIAGFGRKKIIKKKRPNRA